MIAPRLLSHYRAVMVNEHGEECGLVAEGIGSVIVPRVLVAAESGVFVWMKPTGGVGK
jgi:hypothetical protein